jgi:hypothetical protein
MQASQKWGYVYQGRPQLAGTTVEAHQNTQPRLGNGELVAEGQTRIRPNAQVRRALQDELVESNPAAIPNEPRAARTGLTFRCAVFVD